MKPFSFSLRSLPLALLTMVPVFATSTALGDAPSTPPPPSSPSPPSSLGPAGQATFASAPLRSLRVVFHTDTNTVAEGDLRSAIERELQVAVVGEKESAEATLTVTYRGVNRELAVTYKHPSRGSITRIVAAPEKGPEVIATAALLAGNLARNEASEFLEPSASVPVPVPVPVTPPSPPAAPEPVASPFRPLTASIFFPLATHGSEPDARTHVDLNLVYGSVGELDGVGLGTFNRVKGDARGLQLGLAANSVGGKAHGLQISSVYNHAKGEVVGFQGVVFGVNHGGDRVEGIQASVFGANVAEGPVAGGQAALIGNYGGTHIDGLQAAAGFNYAGDNVRGGQLALGLNYAGGAVSGTQASLGVNVAGDVTGGQVGFINVGKRVRGVQFGLINVADDVDGVPIGLVSVSKSGGVHAVAWASNTSLANAGLKFATRHTYTMFSGSAHRENGVDLFGPGFTVGGRFPISPFYLETDIGATHLFGNRLTKRSDESMKELRSNDLTLVKLRLAGGYEFAKHFSVFLGVGVTASIRYAGVPRNVDAVGTDPGPSASPKLAYDPSVSLGGETFAGIQF